MNVFNVILIKGLMAFFTEMEKTILKFVWNLKTLNNQSNLKNKAGSTVCDFQLYYKTVVLKRVWYWHKNRHTDKWNTIKSQEINPHIHGQQILESQKYSTEKRYSSIKGVKKTGYQYAKK